jgi:hypothetical protein
MIQRHNIIGHRIKRIVANTSLSDADFNFADFVCELDNGVMFRLPSDNESEDLLPEVTISDAFQAVRFDKRRWWHYTKRLWWSRIADVLIPADPELRFPDTARIALTSGWYIAQYSGAPRGILPTIDIMPTINADDKMLSVWEVLAMTSDAT